MIFPVINSTQIPFLIAVLNYVFFFLELFRLNFWLFFSNICIISWKPFSNWSLSYDYIFPQIALIIEVI